MPCSPAGFVYVLGAAARVLVGDEGDANRPAFKLHVERLHLDRKLHSVPDLRLQAPIPGFIADICMGARQPKMQPKLVHGRDAIVRRF